MFAMLHSLIRDRRGNILIITGLSMMVLIGIGGAGYDLGRQQLVKQRMQQASDAAALAAATLPTGATEAEREAVAHSMFALNYPAHYLGIARPNPNVNVTNTVTVTADTTVPTSFVVHFNIPTLDVAAKSVVQIQRNANKIDLILVMDNSHSMSGDDITGTDFLEGDMSAMQASCRAVFGSADRIAFFGGFNFTAPTNFCVYPYLTVSGFTYDWGFVGNNRLNTLRYVADEAARALLDPNPNDHRIAVVTWDNMLIHTRDFSDSYADVHTELMRMFATWNTLSTVGMQRAAQLAAGARDDAVLAIVLLTDGRNEVTLSESRAEIEAYNNDTLALCTALKNRPRTLVYTIAFGSVINSASDGPMVRQFMSDCANGPQPNENRTFFPAPDAESLKDAFEQIVGSLKKVQIIE